MEQSKIKSVQANGTYNSKYDNSVMFTYEVELEDGTLGEVACKSEGRWKVGDEVEYTASQSAFGTKLKLMKPNSNFSKGGYAPKNNDLLQKRIDASWSIGQAIAMLGPIKHDDRVKYIAEVDELSGALLDLRNEKL
jgi:hypothetical protein